MAWFVHNPVAANLLMILIVMVGAFTLLSRSIPLEVFPESELDFVSISVPYRGATPEEIEESVTIKIEEAIQDVEGVKEIISYSSENSSSVQIEIEKSFDARAVLDDLKNQVDAISTFPDDIDNPRFSLSTPYRSVISIILSGDFNELELRRLGEQLRDEIVSLPDITQVRLQGVRRYEIAIEIDESTLQEFGLTFERISRAIKNSSVDFPAGLLKTESGDVLLRTRGRAYTQEDFEKIPLLTRPDGVRISLADVASIRDGFNEEPFMARHNGRPCVVIAIARQKTQNAITMAGGIKEFVESIQHRLPPGAELAYWSDRSNIVRKRLDTLYRSAIQGVLLVFLMLSLFLRLRLAFWVCLGIPVCFLGAIACMPFLGITINVVSLFGFILVLGIVVDDAIVTGENIFTHRKRGADPLTGAIEGAQEVARPVIFGVLTTIAAFCPLLMQEGFRGTMNKNIALVVIPVLFFSLIESKLVLPAHLRHMSVKPPSQWNPFTWVQHGFSVGLERFVAWVYQPVLKLALANRYIVLAIFVGNFIVLIGFMAGGRVKQVPFPRVQSEFVTCRLSMQDGTPFENTATIVERIERIAREFQRENIDPATGKSVVENILTSVGGQGIASSRSRSRIGESHLGEVIMEIVSPEDRGLDIDTIQLTREWRQRIGPVIGAREFTFRAEIGRGGDPIDIQLTGKHPDQLEAAAAEVRNWLSEYKGLFDIGDSLDSANPELQLRLKAEAELLGLSMTDFGQQVRQAFYGGEVLRIQRDRDDIRVMLRYPERLRRNLSSLENMYIRTTRDGREIQIPFRSVADVTLGRSPSRIRRVDRNRAVNVTADLEKEEVDLTALTASLTQQLDNLKERNPGLGYSFEGEMEEQQESNSTLLGGSLLVLVVVYGLLAIPFRSYVQPLIVMSVIPFGLIGAVLGHIAMGLPLSILSYFGMLALSGVVVNDSLVLVDYINRRRREGIQVFEAVKRAGAARFRPILLTSVTTFAGLIPLIFEKSTQAQFLIPMAVSLGFGILFATLITLLLVPINYLILNDLARLYGKE